jgi:hypothetical protein
MSSHDEHRLRQALATQARQGTPEPLGLEAVTTRARRIRRRRTTLAALSTAAVVALVVPVGMAMDGTPGSQDAPPVAGEREPTSPRERVALDVGSLAAGEAPGVVWLDRGTLVSAGGDAVELDRSYRQVATFGDGYVVQGILDDETGERVVEVVDGGGSVTHSYPTTDSVAVSSDATLLVFADTEGELFLLQADAAAPTPLETQQGQAKTPVALTGTAPCEEDCWVYYAVSGADGGVNALSVGDGHLENAGPFQRLDAVAPDGRRAGQVSHDTQEPSSCSAVLEGQRQLWRTCDHSLGDFSDDGRHLVGTDAYLDGTGRSMVALLDAATGDPVVTYDVDTRAGDLIADWTWEDEEHLLLTVHSGGSWRVVRVDLDGTAELATDAVPGEDHESSLVLGQHP